MITQKQNEERLELYRNGLSDREVAERMNISRHTIRTWRNKIKLPPNRFRNPIRIKEISENDRIYIAGFFDGEGTAFINHSRKNDTLVPMIQIGNTNKDVILWMVNSIGIKNKIRINVKDKSKNNHKDDYRISISGLNDVKYFIEQIENYCIVKKEILLLTKKFCESRLSKPAHIHYTYNEYEMYEKSKILNKRGRF
jgi:transcriptional regulator with XRE-family HTH domain